MTDTGIIDHLKNNKYSKAINGLYSFFPSVNKFIVSNNGASQDAEDIFQDALVILYKKVNSSDFQLTSSLKTYLHAIVKNLWHEELRKRRKIPVLQGDHDLPDEVATYNDASLKIAEAAFTLLGKKCRQLLIQFYLMKKSFRQIAVSLSFSDEKVAKNQKYRCLQKAKENFLQLSKDQPI
jgi:RNA polymerase sigma factor (sigma-70 family)